jgi:hypothetical protein
MSPSKDLIVIGAGMAGIVAANKCAAAGGIDATGAGPVWMKIRLPRPRGDGPSGSGAFLWLRWLPRPRGCRFPQMLSVCRPVFFWKTSVWKSGSYQ